MFYQVTIERKASKAPGIHVFNLSQEFLEHRVLGPHSKGKPITLMGTTIRCSEITRVRIVETEDECMLLEDADYYLLQLEGFSYSKSERDVTDDLITGPPGWEQEVAPSPKQQPRPKENTREVFVVHGRNNAARNALFDFLRAIDLHPLEWAEAVESTGKASPYIGEILDAVFSKAHAVVVFLTPDDEARLKKPLQAEGDPLHETQLTGQARPNVLFEAGMAMAGNQDRTILVELGYLRPFSDVAGRHVIRMDNSSQRRQELAQRLKAAGCPVNLRGVGWHTVGDFEAAIAQTVQDSPDLAAAEGQKPVVACTNQLSKEAQELLVEATKRENGIILKVPSFGGLHITTNNKDFGERRNPRSEAKWKQAIRDLLDRGLIQDKTGEDKIFEVTHRL